MTAAPVDQELLVRYSELRRPEDRDALVERYAPFAEALARRISRSRNDAEDVAQVARLALVLAIDRYDPTTGVAFTTFAWATIFGELKRYRRDHSWAMRVSRSLQERWLLVQDAIEELTAKNGRSPTMQDIADLLGESVVHVLEAVEAGTARDVDSLDAPLPSGSEREAPECRGPRLAYEAVETRHVVRSLLDVVTDRDRLILRLRFEEDLTQAEIGARLGLSQMHVSRLLRQALARLREASARHEIA